MPNPSLETKFSDANGGKEVFIFPVQLTTNRIGNLTRLILTLAMCDEYIHTYIHVMCGRDNIKHAHFIPIVGVGKRGTY